ncbi:MAG TPA: DUF3450 domain-containing protein [Pseudomonas xinjiangensis]|uniref:DUF3450 domain-containing protein n=2 Tax=root TaxID=1 RepID=A0A7V1BSW0_9GAMM|nr:DUF3450 domain-containing protein [Halopseudomonas xinjiangensis]HEC48891.1 DUF3450 domain-containing protein [Halopseudomonas xinjiangensis]
MKAVWLFLLMVCTSAGVLAQDAGDSALAESEALVNDAQASQQRIDQLDDTTREALLRYRQAIVQREQMLAYTQQLDEMVGAQREELESLQTQLASLEETQREVLPMLQRMLDSLEQFVRLDLPFQSEERAERLAQLRALMARADVSVAEKYRRVLEAYQIESEYGRTLEAWRGTLEADDDTRVVNFLRLGRVMLFYQSLDGQEQGYWNADQGQWSELSDEYRRSLEQGLSIARQQQTPVMVKLPLPAVTERGDSQ